eukprot:TRINITY_DN13386_c5_g1_i1.p2 TRINITY_DN13386_c5_g1~~TRINITY_DN13386_c5_g1_i1.p2  ORF type:complete len:210 (+),score=70.38 TRINITY_DN13386_c5_g1_i1:81-632(+)
MRNRTAELHAALVDATSRPRGGDDSSSEGAYAAELAAAEEERAELLMERRRLVAVLRNEAAGAAQRLPDSPQGAPPPRPPRVRRQLDGAPAGGEGVSVQQLREHAHALAGELSVARQMLEVREEEAAQLRLHLAQLQQPAPGAPGGYVSPSRAAHMQRAENARRAHAAGAAEAARELAAPRLQ